jgi:hypothetical protein
VTAAADEADRVGGAGLSTEGSTFAAAVSIEPEVLSCADERSDEWGV